MDRLIRPALERLAAEGSAPGNTRSVYFAITDLALHGGVKLCNGLLQRVILRYAACRFRVRADECPALLLGWVVEDIGRVLMTRTDGRVRVLPGLGLNKAPGVLEVAVYVLDGCLDAVFLIAILVCSIRWNKGQPLTLLICSPSTRALVIMRSLLVASHRARANELAPHFLRQIPTPRSSTRLPKKNWSPKKGRIMVGMPALKLAPVVPEPP